MEKIIINPEFESEYIDAQSVNFDRGGIILVYKDDRVVGSVYYNEHDPDYPWVITTIIENNGYGQLSDIIDDYPNYTFKFIKE